MYFCSRFMESPVSTRPVKIRAVVVVMVISMVMSMSMLTLVAAGRAGFYFLQAQQAIRYLAMHSKVSSTVNITVYSTVQCTVVDHAVYSTVYSTVSSTAVNCHSQGHTD